MTRFIQCWHWNVSTTDVLSLSCTPYTCSNVVESTEQHLTHFLFEKNRSSKISLHEMSCTKIRSTLHFCTIKTKTKKTVRKLHFYFIKRYLQCYLRDYLCIIVVFLLLGCKCHRWNGFKFQCDKISRNISGKKTKLSFDTAMCSYVHFV